MRKRLDQMTMREYIDIRCGEYPDGVDMEYAVELISQYQEIVDPVGMKAQVHKHGGKVKDATRVKILYIVEFMIDLGYPESAIDIYSDYCGSRYKGTVEQLRETVRKKIKNTEFNIKRAEDIEAMNADKDVAELTPAEVRKHYDSEVASLMVYHKMPLSIDTITASVYANLVYNTMQDIKRRTLEMNRKH